MRSNYTKLLFFVILGWSSVKVIAQRDSSNLDSITISSRLFHYTGQYTNVSRTLLNKTITPINSANTMNILAFLPGVTRSQEMSSGLSIKGGNVYTSKLFVDGMPMRNMSHNLGFFHWLNAQAVDNIKVYDGYVPAQYNSGGGIFNYSLLSPIDDTANLNVSLSPYNINVNVTTKLRKNVGVHANYTESVLDKFPPSDLYSFPTTFRDLLVKGEWRLEKYKSDLNMYVARIEEKQLLGIDFELLNSFRGGNTQQYYGLKAGNSSYNPKKWVYDLSLLFAPYKLRLSGFGRELNLNEQNVRGIAVFKNKPSKIETGLENEFIRSQLIDSVENRELGLNQMAWFVSKAWELAKFKIKTDVRLNMLSLNKDFAWVPLWRIEVEKKWGKHGFFLSGNRYNANYLGVQNNILPIFQDLQIPLFDLNNIPLTNEFNLKYIKELNNVAFQLLGTWSNTQNVVDKNIYDPVSFDLEALKFGKQTYRAISASMSWQNKKNQINTNFTYSKTRQKYEGLNDGLVFNANQDRPFVFNVLYNRYLKHFSLSVQFTAQSGRPFTKPIGYLTRGVLDWSYKNEYRMPIFHHLDLGLKTFDRKIGKHFNHTLQLHAYNVYFKRNIYNVIVIREEVLELSVFPFLLSLEYKVSIR